MKKTTFNYLTLILLTLLFISCSKDNNTEINSKETVVEKKEITKNTDIKDEEELLNSKAEISEVKNNYNAVSNALAFKNLLEKEKEKNRFTDLTLEQAKELLNNNNILDVLYIQKLITNPKEYEVALYIGTTAYQKILMGELSITGDINEARHYIGELYAPEYVEEIINIRTNKVVLASNLLVLLAEECRTRKDIEKCELFVKTALNNVDDDSIKLSYYNVLTFAYFGIADDKNRMKVFDEQFECAMRVYKKYKSDKLIDQFMREYLRDVDNAQQHEKKKRIIQMAEEAGYKVKEQYK